jgi:hypothetical protein
MRTLSKEGVDTNPTEEEINLQKISGFHGGCYLLVTAPCISLKQEPEVLGAMTSIFWFFPIIS